MFRILLMKKSIASAPFVSRQMSAISNITFADG